MTKPTREEILDFWKENVAKKRKSDHYDLTEKSEWVGNYIKLDGMVKELEAVNTEDELRNNLREVFLPTSGLIWSQVPRLFFKLLKEADLRELRDAKEIIVDIRNSSEFKKEWVEDLSNLVETKYPEGAKRFKALKAFVSNVLGELFGKLHFENNPIRNSCSIRILQEMGYTFDEMDYDSFKEAFVNFKKSYQNSVGKLSPKSVHLNIEIDQFFNFFHKDENAKTFLKTGRLSEQPPSQGTRLRDIVAIWQVSPGENELGFWPEFKEKDVIAMGWDKLGRLTQYASKKQIEEALKREYPSYYPPDSNPRNDVNSCWIFCNEIKRGHVIVAKWGSKKLVYGIGKVLEGYEFDDSRELYKHVIRVKWHIKFDEPVQVDISSNFVQWTANSLKLEKFNEVKRSILEKYPHHRPSFDLLFKEEPMEAGPAPPSLAFLDEDLEVNLDELSFKPLLFEDEENLRLQIRAALVSGKNIMLVGPPGTGKTEIALSLCEMAKAKEYVHDYILTTATSDWTTFDTIGGYVPCEEGDSLEFRPGQFLRCFREIESHSPVNKWLVIDEINRSDIDKAFGQLFTVLSGQSVELPFLQESKSVKIVPYHSLQGVGIAQNEYVVPKSWRLVATLNTYDKASLYQMSYAFMRRFAFIHIGVPSPEFIEDNWSTYLDSWGIHIPEKLRSCTDNVKEIWKSMNEHGKRPLGPAIIKDMLEFIAGYEMVETANPQQILTEVVSSFILPQFEGLEKLSLDKLKELLSKYCEETKIDFLFKEMFEG